MGEIVSSSPIWDGREQEGFAMIALAGMR
jgi:hypothetical protein